MSDLVSVIIPVYNSGLYLDRCLESVINQDYPDTEIILIDDGSTDDSAGKCDDWAARYPDKVGVIHQSNQGASLARKVGINTAKGEYLTFVDSDDYVQPQYVSVLYEAAVKYNTGVAVCPFLEVQEGEFGKMPQEISRVSMRLTSKDFFRRFFKYEFWGLCGGLYHKSLFYNLVYPEATIHEDYYLKIQLVSRLRGVGFCVHPLYTYEKHPGSLSNLKVSTKALGEFYNDYAALQFVHENLKEFESHALAIAAESACKWYGVLCQYDNNHFIENRTELKDFLICNFWRILYNQQLLWKIKLIIIKNLVKFNCFGCYV